MAIFNINSSKPNKPSTTLVTQGRTSYNVNGNIGSTPTFGGGITSANSFSPFPYSNTSPIYLVYTRQIGNRTVDLAGNSQTPPLNNSITMRGDNRASLIANGNYNWFTGEFTAPIVDTLVSLCPPNQDSTVTFLSQEPTTVNGNDGSCVQQNLVTYVPPSPTPSASVTPSPTKSAGATPTPTATSTPTATPTPTPSTSSAPISPYTQLGYHETTLDVSSKWWQIYGIRTATNSIDHLNLLNGWHGVGFDQDSKHSYNYADLIPHTMDVGGTTVLVDPNNSSIKMPISVDKVGETFTRSESITLPTGRVFTGNNRYYTNTVIGQTLSWGGTMPFVNGYVDTSTTENAPIYTAGALKKVWSSINNTVGNTIRILGASINGDFYPNYWWGSTNTVSSGDVLIIRWRRTVYSASGIWADEIWQTEYIQGHMPDWATSNPSGFGYGVTPVYSMPNRIDPAGNINSVPVHLFKKEISVAGDGRSGVYDRTFSSNNWGRQRLVVRLDTEGNISVQTLYGFGDLVLPAITAPTSETLYETRNILSMEAESSVQSQNGWTARFSGNNILQIRGANRFNQVRAASVMLTD